MIHRKCDRCNEEYYRRNLVEAWTSRSLGHKRGWVKEVARVCIKCMSVKESRKIIDIVQIGFKGVKV